MTFSSDLSSLYSNFSVEESPFDAALEGEDVALKNCFYSLKFQNLKIFFPYGESAILSIFLYCAPIRFLSSNAVSTHDGIRR